MQAARPNASTTRIFVVEDNPVHRKLLARALRQFELTEVGDAESAYGAMEADGFEDIDVVVTDYRIPSAEGEIPDPCHGHTLVEALAEIKRHRSRPLPIILMISDRIKV